MTPDMVLALGRESAQVVLLVAGPILLVALLTGLLVSIVQAVTQIQEMTLTFIPKIVAMMAVIALLGHWMLGQLVGFTASLLGNLHLYGR
jgi:flagellar biosynthetic protein FliQ